MKPRPAFISPRMSLTIGILTLLFIAALATAGCTASTNPGDSEQYSEVDLKLNDGRTIHCLYYKGDQRFNGFSCDWANAK